DDEIEGTGAHGGHNRLDAASGRLHDDRRTVPLCAQTFEHFDSVDSGHDEVEHNDADFARLRSRHRLERRFAAVGQRRRVAELGHRGLQQSSLDGVVIDYEYAVGHENLQTLRYSGSWAGSYWHSPLNRGSRNPVNESFRSGRASAWRTFARSR